MFEVRQEAFNGPLYKLLELIEEQKLEITTVNLAKVTEDFIHYIQGLGETIDSAVLSDFIVVAARLLVIKSKVLLPSLELSQEEEGDILDLEQRLKIYREFSAKGGSASGGKSAAQHIVELWNRNQIGYGRPLLASLGEQSFFYPSKQITTARLENAMVSLFAVLQGLIPEIKHVKMTVITLQEKIAELTQRLTQASTITMKGRASKEEKQEIIVLFLAVLHMLAARTLQVEQTDMFSDIVVTKTQPENL